ncbi:MAG: thiol-disulfide oxidoreductase DCC family protein [Chitinophagales bacterium]
MAIEVYTMTNAHPIIFFDGVCYLCNASVQYILQRDKKDVFRFAALQSDFTASFFRAKQFVPDTDSIVLYSNNHFYTQSTAALKIASMLPVPAKLWYICIVVPPFIRNPVYNWIAKNRYRWFGRTESCMIPSTNVSYKFIDS